MNVKKGHWSSKPDPRKKYYYWCFTLNNPTPADEAQLEEFGEYKFLDWMVYQLEKGKSGTPHYQGTFRLKANRTLRFVSGKLSRAHFEITKVPKATIEYCSKCCDDYKDPNHVCLKQRLSETVVIGDVSKLMGQGKRNDIASLEKFILTEANDARDVLEQFPGMTIRYHKGIQKIFDMKMAREPKHVPTIICIYGDSNTGKTSYIKKKHVPEGELDNDYIFKVVGGTYGNVWFNGYTTQEVVVFDDFYGWIKYAMLLQYTDRYETTVPVHGGERRFNPKYIYFTSNQSPLNWYKNIKDVSSLIRRFTKIWRIRNGVLTEVVMPVSGPVSLPQPARTTTLTEFSLEAIETALSTSVTVEEDDSEPLDF